MKKSVKGICLTMALCSAFGFVGCMKDDGAIKLTVWVSEAEKAESEEDDAAFDNEED
jgi:hypothetical protein